MRCDEACEALLAADIAMTPNGDRFLDVDQNVERHLAMCRRCSDTRALILAATDAVGRVLDEPAAMDFDTLVDEAMADTSLGVIPPSDPTSGGSRILQTHRWALGGLAAAAVLAAVLAYPPSEFRRSSDLDLRVVTAGEAVVPSSVRAELGRQAGISLPADQNAAILKTDNPNLTIIWFYGGEE